MMIKILNFLLIAITALFTGSSGIVISLLFFYIIGTTISYQLSNNDVKDKKNLVSLFNTAFLIYTLIAILSYLDFINGNMMFFKHPDQFHFYEVADELGKKSNLYEIFYDCFIDRIHDEQEASYFYFGSLALIANSFLDGNSVLFQSIHVSFFAILINLFLYKILLFYINRKTALKYTLYFLLFAYILSFSPWILRDIHIALLFTIAIYIVHLEFSIKKIFILLILQLIVFEFRFENGMIFSFFPLLFTYNNAKKSRYRGLHITLICLVLLAGVAKYSTSLIANILHSTDTLERYNELSSTSADESGGVGKMIFKLPIGAKQIASVVISQISPFPPWNDINKSETFIQGVIGFISGLAPLFWGFVFFTSVKYYKYYKTLSFLTKSLVLFAIIFLFLSSANMLVRRLIPVYPIIYMFFVYVISKLSKKQIRKNISTYTMIYSGLLVVYFFIKFL
ncbi:hypothetical protein ACFFU9_09895 [Mariniflexile ostreae]|uniref:Dolichyl-phosphate-mannose-protein mannosyltransferase n=1 Tax=Mariniflexile ostreae TaxID=1520892 RepID=A0ABV5FC89_9FLAO